MKCPMPGCKDGWIVEKPAPSIDVNRLCPCCGPGGYAETWARDAVWMAFKNIATRQAKRNADMDSLLAAAKKRMEERGMTKRNNPLERLAVAVSDEITSLRARIAALEAERLALARYVFDRADCDETDPPGHICHLARRIVDEAKEEEKCDTQS